MSVLHAINLHHLYYFWCVAKDGNLTRTAKQLHVAQSALSSQIRQLESQLGTPLFVRAQRRLTLTESGEIARRYADEIFTASGELVATLRDGQVGRQPLRIGAVATLSRNLQELFVAPLLATPRDVHLVMRSGGLEELLGLLVRHELDVVLSNRRPAGDPEHRWQSKRIARQPLSLIGRRARKRFRFPDDLVDVPLILPGPTSESRSEFDAICEAVGLRPAILAEVDDMAAMRLLARDTDSIALLPAVVVRDELRDRVLHEYGVVPGLFESFYAVTLPRRYRHPLLAKLIARDESEVLQGPTVRASRGR